jgi:signal transduction histidine kinase
MMKRPWQVWLLFSLCLAVVLPAMVWLTLKALELDRAEAIARSQAEMEEEISLALWRMDSALAPLLAQESARPYFAYQPFNTLPAEQEGKGVVKQVPSPLLVQPSEYVLLNFQCTSTGKWSSPQAPEGILCDLAVDNGVKRETIDENAGKLTQLSTELQDTDLIAQLPRETLPQIQISLPAWNTAPTRDNTASFDFPQTNAPLDDAQAKVNDLGLQQLDQQLEELNLPQAQAPEQQASQQQGKPFYAYGKPRSRREQMLRGGYEWNKRNQAFQNYAQQAVVQQRVNTVTIPAAQLKLASEGVSRPIWVKSRLLLARRVTVGDDVMVQGCWLNWPRIKELLLSEISDRLPVGDLAPVTSETTVSAGRMLATLPVQLIVPRIQVAPSPLSPIRLSLVVAWICLLLAAGAVAILLMGVIRLSERRGAFVSAVTHELRTPLTTFRMYAEMLAEDMVPDQTQRKKYLETLRVEADRLSHLVENVLAYARLERGRRNGAPERLTAGELLGRVESRLGERARQAGMELQVQASADGRSKTLRTNVSVVEQILFNLVDNASKYAAHADDRRIELNLSATDRQVLFRVRDHGPGISDHALTQLFQPFSKSAEEAAHSAPGVGLGLALCHRLAHDLGGRLRMEKSNGDGASFVLTMPTVSG